MKLKFFFLLLLLIASTSIVAQINDKVLAEIGNLKITISEFKIRYELSPFVTHKTAFNQDTIKSEFLLSMIAEKLWYLEAVEKGLLNSEDFKFYFKPIEDIFLRDYLFKQEVENKIKITAEDLTQAINNSQFALKSRIITSNNSSLIHNFYQELVNHTSIDSLLHSNKFSSLISNEFEIKLGSLKDEEVENYLFTLNVDEFTKPIRSEVGWVIFYITNKTFTPIDLSDQKQVNDIKKIIRSRRILIRTNEYLKELLSKKTFDINDELFTKVFEETYKLIQQKFSSKEDSVSTSYVLNDWDYSLIKTNLGDSVLNSTLFKIGKKNVTVWDFLANLAFEEHKLNTTDKRILYSQLSRFVKDFAYQQVLTNEARKKGLDKNKNLLTELQQWKINYLANQLRFQFLDSARVSDEEVLNYIESEYQKEKPNLLYNLKILTLSDLPEIEKTLNEISSGKSFDEILSSYGRTDSLVNEKGETGLHPRIYFRDLSPLLDNLKINEVFGPIRRDRNSFSLIMLTQRVETEDSLKLNFNSTKRYIKDYLSQKKFNSFIANKTLQLVDKYNVRIYKDVLSEITTTKIPMFIHRLMGFGGRVAGVPYLDNWFNYIEDYQLKSKILP